MIASISKYTIFNEVNRGRTLLKLLLMTRKEGIKPTRFMVAQELAEYLVNKNDLFYLMLHF